ncbi:MAG: PEP-CTERM sorting domain-containing protein [Okeania sp. SIO2D1]|nr:PEP-CTERM sorting domain-containing protein [Okeania sp. SIO2D1]
MFTQKTSTVSTLIGSSILGAGVIFAAVMPAQAASLSTSASCPGDSTCDGGINTNYGYTIELLQDTADASIFYWTLTNTSTQTNPEALIDQFWFNTNSDLTLGTDFTISAINPNTWTISAVSQGNVKFDFTGDANSPSDRLGNGEALSFTIDLNDNLGTTAESFSDYFFNAEEDAGQGIGGGQDVGQVAVSFQQLGAGGEDSDLLTSNWEQLTTPPQPGRVPEPTSILALGLISGGMLLSRRRKNG